MPFTFLSHQAAVLPLKMAAPRRFSGTALALGSMAPDLEYFVRLRPHRAISHTLAGQIVFCLPVTLALLWLVVGVIARPLALHLPDCGGFHLRDYRVVARKRFTASFWLIAALSALVGSFSHIAWDSLTHEHGWGVRHLPALRTEVPLLHHRVPLHRLLQHGSTVGGAVITLGLLHAIGRRRLVLQWAGCPSETVEPSPTPASRRSLWLAVAIGPFVGAAAGLTRALDLSGGLAAVQVPHNGAEPALLAVLASVFFGAVTFTFLGICVGCLAANRRMKAPEGCRS
jgi:hypothetical protein